MSYNDLPAQIFSNIVKILHGFCSYWNHPTLIRPLHTRYSQICSSLKVSDTKSTNFDIIAGPVPRTMRSRSLVHLNRTKLHCQLYVRTYFTVSLLRPCKSTGQFSCMQWLQYYAIRSGLRRPAIHISRILTFLEDQAASKSNRMAPPTLA